MPVEAERKGVALMRGVSPAMMEDAVARITKRPWLHPPASSIAENGDGVNTSLESTRAQSQHEFRVNTRSEDVYSPAWIRPISVVFI